jgi:hypothetical protein
MVHPTPAVSEPENWSDTAAAVSEVTTESHIIRGGEGRPDNGVKKVRIKLHSKLDALSKLGQHIGMFKMPRRRTTFRSTCCSPTFWTRDQGCAQTSHNWSTTQFARKDIPDRQEDIAASVGCVENPSLCSGSGPR